MGEGPDNKRESGPTICDRARWLLRARPADYLLAASVASARLPIVGRHLEPLGGAAAMGVWGARVIPELLGATTRTRPAPEVADAGPQPYATSDVFAAALRDLVSPMDLQVQWPAPQRSAPVLKSLEYRRNLHRSGVRYGDHPAQVLDVWRRKDLAGAPAPVLIFVPGGAWVHGSRMLQGYALLSHLAEQGWVCLSIDYRVAPHHRWPQHIHDVKSAIAWARANVDRFGGDRNFVTIAGASAGGHLASLAGLTIDDPAFQTHLPEGSDTSVDAVIGIYGRYDWEDRSTDERARFLDFLERVVVNKRQERHPEVFRNASPMARVHADAPPFFVVHGTGDSVIPVAQARSFVEHLRSVSRSVTGYLEIPRAGHGFDMTDGSCTESAAAAIGLFLNQIHHNWSRVAAKEVI